MSLFALVLLLFSLPVHAQLNSRPPEGFEDLDAERLQQIDLYFEGRLIGIFEVTYEGESATFSDPASVMQALPLDLQTTKVLDALSAPLNRNVSRACPRNSVGSDCGTLQPELVGIVHYADRFEIRLFVNSALRDRSAEPIYLPSPAPELDIQSYGSFILSGGDDDSGPRVNAEIDTVASFGEVRLLNTLTYTDQNEVQVDEMLGEVDFDGGRVFSGVFWSKGPLGLQRERIIGVGFQSQVDTRLDKEILLGTPLTIYMQARGKVEVLLDGRVLYVTTFPAGSNSIDTTSFPQGNYVLRLRVTLADGVSRTETRFFSKGVAVPQINTPIYFAEFGMPKPINKASNEEAGFEGPLARVGAAWRVDEKFALGTGAQYVQNELETRLTASHFNDDFVLDATGAIGTKGSKFGSMSLISASRGSLNYSIDARYVDFRRNSPDANFLATDRYGRINASVSWVHRNLRLAMIANSLHLKDRDQYSIAATGQYDFVRRSDLFVSLVGDYTKANIGNSWSLGISLRMFGSKVGAASSVGYRNSGSGPGSRGIFSIHTLNTSHDLDFDKRLFGSVTYEVAPEVENLSGTADFDAKSFAFSGNYLETTRNGESFSQFAVGGSGSLIFSNNRISPGHRAPREATIVVEIEGSAENERFDLLIDGRLHSIVEGGEKRTVVLPSYREYRMRLRPRQSGPMTVINPVRNISLYPGNVREIEWKIQRKVAVVGRLVDALGDPLRNATLRWEQEIAVTDEKGFFQIEAAPSATVDVWSFDGTRLRLKLPSFEESLDYIRIGQVMASEVERDGS